MTETNNPMAAKALRDRLEEMMRAALERSIKQMSGGTSLVDAMMNEACALRAASISLVNASKQLGLGVEGVEVFTEMASRIAPTVSFASMSGDAPVAAMNKLLEVIIDTPAPEGECDCVLCALRRHMTGAQSAASAPIN